VEEEARRCPFCGVPVASVRCGLCFHMNVPEALHCSGCGAAIGLEPVAEPGSLTCPSCEGAPPLEVIRYGEGRLHDCGRCGGQFVEHAMLRELLATPERVGAAALGQTARAKADLRVRYLPCPACKTLMARKNFGGKSGVIIDACRQHGVWFDLGELPRVLAFVQSGGLASPAARAARDSVVDPPSDRLRYASATPEHRMAHAELDSVDDVARVGHAVVDFLFEMLTGR
jgi:Zn-finger nucleic acid-binding protein